MLVGKSLLSALSRMSCGGLILDTSGEVLIFNAAAERNLREGSGASSQQPLTNDDAREALKALLRAGETRFTLDHETWAVVERPGRRPLAIHATRLSDGVEPGPQTMVVLMDFAETPQPSPATLQKIFGLTTAEASLAVRIAKGESLAGVADGAGVSMATARSQLAAIFAKTATRRQAELVALLTRVALLP